MLTCRAIACAGCRLFPVRITASIPSALNYSTASRLLVHTASATPNKASGFLLPMSAMTVFAMLLKRGELLLQFMQARIWFIDEPVVAQRVRHTLDNAFDAAPIDALEAGHLQQRRYGGGVLAERH
jgi:hypothetical protein